MSIGLLLKSPENDGETRMLGSRVQIELNGEQWCCHRPHRKAYYEYICKRKGIAVAHVADQPENDGSPVSTIVEGVNLNPATTGLQSD